MVMKRVRGHQFHYSGHTVTFLQDIVKFSSALPLLPEDLDIVMLLPQQIWLAFVCNFQGI